MNYFYRLSFFLTIISSTISRPSSSSTCPENCLCDRKQNETSNNYLSSVSVSCIDGDLDDRLFARIMSKMPEDVSIMKIIAPENRPNRLTITQDFERFRSLKELHLINCGLRSLGKRTFENVKSLRILNVGDNQIENLSPDTFTNTDHLIELNLRKNRLNRNTLPTGTFAHLRNLQSLDLSENNIDKFSTTNLFAGLTNLKTLNLNENVMDAKSFDVFLDLPNLEKLSLSDCQLSDVPLTSFRRNPSLKSLILSKNKLRTTFYSAFKHVSSLEYLDLSTNVLTNIAESTFKFIPNLKKLILSHNFLGFTMNDDAYRQRGSAGNMLNVSVDELDLTNNSINVFKSSYLFENLIKSIKILHLSSNKLTNITMEQTENMTNLKRLHLSDVHLAFLPDKLPVEYAKLKFFDISNNEISSISVDQTNFLRSLSTLNLSNNNFTTLNDNLRQFLIRLNYVNLTKNRWDCQDCRTLVNLQAILKNREFYVSWTNNDDDVRCSSTNFVGKLVKFIDKDDRCKKFYGAVSDLSSTSQNEIGLMIAGLCALTLIIVLTTTVVCCYFWNRHSSSNSHIYRTSETKEIDETATLSSTSSENSARIQPSIRDLTKLR